MNCNGDLALLLWLRRRRRRQEQESQAQVNRRTVRWWVHPIIEQRLLQGAYNNLVLELRRDSERFFNFHRMSPLQFDQLLAMIEPIITKAHFTREPLHPGLRLSLTLRYLAIGDSMVSLHYLYRIGKSTVPKILVETMEVLWLKYCNLKYFLHQLCKHGLKSQILKINGIFQIALEQLMVSMLLHNVLKIQDQVFTIIKVHTALFY